MIGHALEPAAATGADNDRSHLTPHLLTVAVADFGTAFQRGRRIRPARNVIPPSVPNTPLHPHCLLMNPGKLPPSIPPIDPRPLMSPLAVDAPFFVPKSIADTPTIKLSAANRRKPIRNNAPPSIQ